MFGQASGGNSPQLLVLIAIAALVILVRNARPRRLRVEGLWIIPLVYVAILVALLAAAPPPVTPLAIGVLVAGAVIGGAIGWQRGRFTRIDLDPQTHEMTSRASVVGIAFILVVLLARVGLRSMAAEGRLNIGLPPLVIADGLLVLAMFMLSVQRLEIWLRASRMLAEARAGGGPPVV
ncbi:hypothetical protein ACO2Q3_07500 [Caulobacter sp. KR2-114]|uniref:hypothetical protein n=1 Tax=Caulobacter sp. KR2-114 TaxID=3400912 RepID=UPI003C012114